MADTTRLSIFRLQLPTGATGRATSEAPALEALPVLAGGEGREFGRIGLLGLLLDLRRRVEDTATSRL